MCSTPLQVFSVLSGEKLAIELVTVPKAKTVASFQTDVTDILFGSPHLMRKGETRTHYLSLILQHFPVNQYILLVIIILLKQLNYLGRCKTRLQCYNQSQNDWC